MTRQILFAAALALTLGIFSFTAFRITRLFLLTRPAFPVRQPGKRIGVMIAVSFGQTRILRKPAIGFLHALVFWGFCVILFGSLEMVVDGLTGSERSFGSLGTVYDIIIASGDIFSLLVGIAILVFLFRRLFLHIRRFDGIEMKHISHVDANIALILILLLMISLLGMNMAYVEGRNLAGLPVEGVFPVSTYLSVIFSGMDLSGTDLLHEIFWWTHILLIFLFANILPYSKHFHVFMSVPNVFLSRLDPLGKLPNMDTVTREVKLMMDPGSADPAGAGGTPPERFGIRDCEDITWKNYLDALACTECGRCTAVCPANLTGKKLSPRKIMMDVRARMKEKGPGLIRNGRGYDDRHSLVRDYISEEEIWACTTCNACARECPVSINHPVLIVDLRRYLVMEEGSAPGMLKTLFTNTENNGAPWKFSPEDRLLWAKDLTVKTN